MGMINFSSAIIPGIQNVIKDVVEYVTPDIAPWGYTELTSGNSDLDHIITLSNLNHNPVPILDDLANTLVMFPVAKPIINYATNEIVSTLYPMNEEIYEQAVNKVTQVAQQANEAADNGQITDVQAFQIILQEAAEQSGNNADGFMQLVNEAVVGSSANQPGPGWSFYDVKMNQERIDIGDTGAYSGFQDDSEMQLSYHYWAYVNQGEMGLGPLGIYLAHHHEKEALDSGFGGASIEDFDIGLMGIQMGTELQNGTLTPEEFAEQFPDYLGTSQFAGFTAVTSILNGDTAMAGLSGNWKFPSVNNDAPAPLFQLPAAFQGGNLGGKALDDDSRHPRNENPPASTPTATPTTLPVTSTTTNPFTLSTTPGTTGARDMSDDRHSRGRGEDEETSTSSNTSTPVVVTGNSTGTIAARTVSAAARGGGGMQRQAMM